MKPTRGDDAPRERGSDDSDARQVGPRTNRGPGTSLVPPVDRATRMLEEVVDGLSRSPKTLPSKYFYDEAGSELFDEITRLDEYYLTRTETRIMEEHADAIAAEIGPGALIVEPGSGSSEKTRILLDHLVEPAAYVPVDISGEYLAQAARGLRLEHPGLTVTPLVADFTEPLRLPPTPMRPKRRVVYFPGSTIGNFLPLEATRLLTRLRTLVGPEGGVLIGYDLVKSRDVLEAAYDDAAGVTARFNLNILVHLNRVLDADFDMDAFEHHAPFDSEASRIEMYLVSRRRQRVRIGGHLFELAEGEAILTEYSHKYTLDQFAALASSAGLAPHRTWTDPEQLFCVQLLAPTSA